MRASLAHQNPLRALPLPRGQGGPFAEPAASFLAVDAPDVIVTAAKPVEEAPRGFAVRAWELGGAATDFTIDASAFAPSAAWETTLVETDRQPAPIADGHVAASLAANAIGTWRFLPTSPPPAAGPARSTRSPQQVPPELVVDFDALAPARCCDPTIRWRRGCASAVRAIGPASARSWSRPVRAAARCAASTWAAPIRGRAGSPSRSTRTFAPQVPT
jgi:hypothetical protein